MALRYAWNSGVSHSQSATLIGSESDFRNAPSFHSLMRFVMAVYCVAFVFVDTFRMKPSR
mgnify:CR=1 FL=1